MKTCRIENVAITVGVFTPDDDSDDLPLCLQITNDGHATFQSALSLDELHDLQALLSWAELEILRHGDPTA